LQDGHISGGLISTIVLPQLLHFHVFSGMVGLFSVMVNFSLFDPAAWNHPAPAW
jgi:hypothetical protein